MYRVIKMFTDLQDGNYRYEVGDTYPREGLSPTDKRIAELAGDRNRQKTPLIEEVRVTVADEAEKPKRSRRKAETEENGEE